MKNLLYGCLLSTVFFTNSNAQDITNPKNTGKLYVIWGWNWGYYSHSDIHFTGNEYDFTLQHVASTDNQTPFNFDDYFNPAKITIPQTNFRIGYYLNDHLSLAIGVDHMKYFVTNDQTVKINGFLNGTGTGYDGTYANDDITLYADFLTFEHSDGLNYINLEASYAQDIMTLVGQPKKNFQAYMLGGVGAGIIFPKTNVQLVGKPRHDDFNVAGFGMALKAGLNLTIYRYFFVQSELKAGFIDLPNIRTTPDISDKASQHFFYLMPDLLIGVVFQLVHPK